MVDGVGRLQRGNNILGARQHLEGLDCLRVRDSDVICPPGILEPRVLGPDPRVVKSSGNRVCFGDLTVVVLRGEGGGHGGRGTTSSRQQVHPIISSFRAGNSKAIDFQKLQEDPTVPT